MMFVVTNRELRNQAADRIENRVERVPVSREDHPCGQRSRPFLAEGVEALVDDHPGIRFARASALDRVRNAVGDRIRDRPGKLALKPGGGPEMVKQICVRPTDLGRDGLQRHRLRPLVEQQLPCCRKSNGSAFFRAEAGPSY